jgi:predicted phage tail protein
MLRKIRLYGELAKFVGHRVLEADVASAAEAVRFLLANWPELEQHMAQQHYRVRTAAHDLGEEDLHNPMGRELRIIPVIVGAGTVGRIILGVALIALAFIPGVGWAAAAAAKAATATTAAVAATSAGFNIAGAILFNLGTGLVLTGIAQLLTPTPKINTTDEGDPRKSFSFSGIQNVSRAGVPVPVVYGEIITGSVVISASIDIVQVIA